MNENMDLSRLVPRSSVEVWNVLRQNDFIYNSKMNPHMKSLYDEMIRERDKYEFLYRQFGYTLIYSTDGYIQLASKLNKVQKYQATFKIALIAYVVYLCSLRNTIIRNNEALEGQTFTYESYCSCIDSDENIKRYLQQIYINSPMEDCKRKLIEHMLKRGVLETDEKGDLLTVTPVFLFYKSFIFQVVSLLKDYR